MTFRGTIKLRYQKQMASIKFQFRDSVIMFILLLLPRYNSHLIDGLYIRCTNIYIIHDVGRSFYKYTNGLAIYVNTRYIAQRVINQNRHLCKFWPELGKY